MRTAVYRYLHSDKTIGVYSVYQIIFALDNISIKSGIHPRVVVSFIVFPVIPSGIFLLCASRQLVLEMSRLAILMCH